MKETKKDNQVILKEKKDLNKKGEESEFIYNSFLMPENWENKKNEIKRK